MLISDLDRLKPVLKKYVPRWRIALIPCLYAAREIFGRRPEPLAVDLGLCEPSSRTAGAGRPSGQDTRI